MKPIPKLSNEEIEFRKIYYNHPVIKDRLLNSFKNKEVIIMDKYENWKCQRLHTIRKTEKTFSWKKEKTDFYDFWINFIHIDSLNYNLYLSVANYKYIPPFPLNPEIRSIETSKFFSVAYKYIGSYDIFFDFDIIKENDFNDMKIEILNFLSAFCGCNYLILASGTGIQIIFNSLQFPEFEKQDFFLNKIYHYKIAEKIEDLKKKLNLKFLCCSGIRLLTRFRKCEFSLNETTPVLLLTIEEFKKFTYDKIKNMSFKERLEYVLSKILCGIEYNENTGE